MKLNIQRLNKTDYIKLLIPVLYGVLYYLVRDNVWGTAYYFVGWYLGVLLMFLDKNVLYKYYYESIHQKEDKFARLVTRSIFFLLSYFGLSLFLITSSGSALGMGLIMGIGLVLSFELWNSRNYVDFFNQYFIQSTKRWDQVEITNFIRIFLAFYLIVSIISVI
jgi:hypothetical protein